MLSAQEFLGTTITKASEKLKLIPVSDAGYAALIATDGLDLKDFKYKQGDKAGQVGYRMTVKWEIQDPDLKTSIGRTPSITQSFTVNFTPEGALATENPGLRNLREAVGQNKDGEPWQPAMLIGQMAKIFVSHRIDDKGEEQQDVQRVVAL